MCVRLAVEWNITETAQEQGIRVGKRHNYLLFYRYLILKFQAVN